MSNCSPVIGCADPPDNQLYSLEDPPLASVKCPVGSQSDTVTLVCCGHALTANLAGMNPGQKTAAINELVNQCLRSLAFCQVDTCDNDNDAGDPSEGTALDPCNFQFFGNNPITSSVTCQDGTVYTVTTPGCAFLAPSQAEADALAKAKARIGTATPICLSDLPHCLCVGIPYSANLTVLGQLQSLVWTVSGNVPPGLTVNTGTGSSITVTGTPTTSGTYSFQVTAKGSSGNFVKKGFTFTVLEITTNALPPFAVGVPYSYQMMVSGGSGNYQWGILTGSLPDGLIISTTGLISGTPTGSSAGLITFIVTDLNCEAASPRNTPPQVHLSAVSTMKVATIKGYPEWIGFESSPPKKFHDLTWSGTSEHQLWIGDVAVPANQIGGARYEYSGTDTIDTHGDVVATHLKELFVQCDGDFDSFAEVQGNRAVTGESIVYSFRGYWGVASIGQPQFILNNPDNFSPTLRLCTTSSIPYDDIGDMAVNGPSDSSDLWGSRLIPQTVNLGISKFTGQSNILATSVETGTDSRLAMPYLIKIQTAIPQTAPADFWQGCSIVYNHNYSATLSNEFTLTEALGNALTTISNSTTAQNIPATTGFVYTFTTVVFTLNCTNLVAGQIYNASVEFFDSGTGATTVSTYPFTATASTHAVSDSIPTPLPGHTLQARHPKISFAP